MNRIPIALAAAGFAMAIVALVFVIRLGGELGDTKARLASAETQIEAQSFRPFELPEVGQAVPVYIVWSEAHEVALTLLHHMVPDLDDFRFIERRGGIHISELAERYFDETVARNVVQGLIDDYPQPLVRYMGEDRVVMTRFGYNVGEAMRTMPTLIRDLEMCGTVTDEYCNTIDQFQFKGAVRNSLPNLLNP